MEKVFDLIIIGAGPAGMFAAAHAGGSVLVLEKNATAGKKLLISGTGRCNFTHVGPISNFLPHYGDNFRFVKPALYAFDNQKVINFFEQNGMRTVTDKNGKVFPASQDARDVLGALLNAMRKNNVQVKYNQHVAEVAKQQDVFTVKTQETIYYSRNLLITTGGMSYPATGCTGDGYHFAHQLGHSIVPPKPSLSPIFVKEYHLQELAGIGLKQKEVYLYRDNKKLRVLQGDMGFTHKGLSGPVILDGSRNMKKGDVLKINFVEQNADIFRQKLIEVSAKQGSTLAVIFLRKFELPKSLVDKLLAYADLSNETRLGEITKPQRTLLITACCEYPFEIEKIGGFNTAMATAGGITLSEINPNTMESRLVQGLYFAGEVLDIDGDTGGYNLQAAFSTGFLAGNGGERG